jgi:hypothetical protein
METTEESTEENAAAPLADDDRDEVTRRELSLLDPAVRASPARVLALLHPDFLEFGASGQTWDSPGVVAALTQAGSSPDEPPARVADLVCDRLAADVWLLTFSVHRQERVSLRSSIWVRDDERGWLLRFHQGTVGA